jgi:hypothetical protein
MRRRVFLFSLTILPILSSCGRADIPLSVNTARIDQLRALRGEPKFQDLPGTPAEQERKRFEPLANSLLDRLIEGIQRHPGREWVLEQMDPFVAEFYLEDTELRERCLAYIERIFGILGILDDGGAFRKYLIFW